MREDKKIAAKSIILGKISSYEDNNRKISRYND